MYNIIPKAPFVLIILINLLFSHTHLLWPWMLMTAPSSSSFPQELFTPMMLKNDAQSYGACPNCARSTSGTRNVQNARVIQKKSHKTVATRRWSVYACVQTAASVSECVSCAINTAARAHHWPVHELIKPEIDVSLSVSLMHSEFSRTVLKEH